jgi:uncharacterized protein (DUF4213/DUF364 family)
MGVTEQIEKLALESVGEAVVKDIRLGRRYCAVMLDSGATGVAYSFLSRSVHGPGPTPQQIMALVGKGASRAIEWFRSDNPIYSAIALATANALFSAQPRHYLPGDILDHIDLGPADTVTMVGHFAPLLPAVKERVKDIKVFEQKPDPGAGILPASEAPHWISRSHVVLMTATAIINGTIDHLLEFCTPCREVVILGPSTPMIPEAFYHSPVTILSGILVIDGAGVLDTVSQGGGTRRLRPYSKKVNLRIK